MTADQTQAALINRLGAYLNACRPPVDATTQQTGQAISDFNELVKPLVEAINARAAAPKPATPDPVA